MKFGLPAIASAAAKSNPVARSGAQKCSPALRKANRIKLLNLSVEYHTTVRNRPIDTGIIVTIIQCLILNLVEQCTHQMFHSIVAGWAVYASVTFQGYRSENARLEKRTHTQGK